MTFKATPMGDTHSQADPLVTLVTALDEKTAERWHDHDASYAWLGPTGEVHFDVPPERRVLAVAASSLGIARRMDLDGAAEAQTVRITASVSCCQTLAVLRHACGRTDRSDRVDGATIKLLRGWASLLTCPSCEVAS